jgi:hypothetical protein
MIQTSGNPPFHLQEKRQEREKRVVKDHKYMLIMENYSSVMCWRRMESVR